MKVLDLPTGITRELADIDSQMATLRGQIAEADLVYFRAKKERDSLLKAHHTLAVQRHSILESQHQDQLGTSGV